MNNLSQRGEGEVLTPHLTHCLLSSIHNMRRLGALISAYITEIEVKLHGDYRQYSPHIMRI